ncbi:MAG: phage Gp37/Gp68 family protein [Elusimicrobiales bacterium]|nr:phage Gp37/Gp68 family protein [Elusimicrobiales bacterium]
MGIKTGIQWATATWNPWMGCTKVSPACDNCYAESWMKRWGRDFNNISHSKSTFWDPEKWKEPQRIFVCSLSDFFHPVPDDWRYEAFEVMSRAPQHTYMILTKRPAIMSRWMGKISRLMRTNNIWLGVTAENQEQADKRIPLLLQIPAAVHFVSVEPMLGPVDLSRYLAGPNGNAIKCGCGWRESESGIVGATPEHEVCLVCTQNPQRFQPVRWVICGGESGPGARPMHPDWARSLRDQCAVARVPFFFKQWGEWTTDFHAGELLGAGIKYPAGCAVHHLPAGRSMWRVGKDFTGRLLDGREHNELPEVMRHGV